MPDAYHLKLSDAERAQMERSAHLFHRDYGKPMFIPPKLFSDLKAAGVDMKHMLPDPSLET